MKTNGVLAYIDLPRKKTLNQTLIRDRGRISNLLIAAMSKYGFQFQAKQPARWGFGAIAKPIKTAPNQPKFHRVERVMVGSSDPTIASAIAQLKPEDLIESNANDALDLRTATIRLAPPWIETEAVNFYCISPIRVLDLDLPQETKDRAVLTIDTKLNQAINRTMETRFKRQFHLKIIPDSLYIRSRKGQIKSTMAIKTLPSGKAVTLSGLVFPFTLTGSSDDIAEVWYNGIGQKTGQGFGRLEVAQWT